MYKFFIFLVSKLCVISRKLQVLFKIFKNMCISISILIFVCVVLLLHSLNHWDLRLVLNKSTNLTRSIYVSYLYFTLSGAEVLCFNQFIDLLIFT